MMAAPGNRGVLRWRQFLAAWPLCIFLASCTTLKVPVRMPKVSGPTFQASRDGVTLGAHPIEGRENYWDLFDDELPKIGIAAVWVRIENSRAEPIDLSDLTWTLEAGTERFSALSIDQVLERFYDRRDVRFYSLNSDRKAREDLEKVMLKSGPLAPSAVSQGFVFLDVDYSSAAWLEPWCETVRPGYSTREPRKKFSSSFHPSMLTHESEAVVLRQYPLSEADRIVVFFTREYGKIRAVAQGAKRLKSRMGGCLEPLNHIYLRFYLKEGGRPGESPSVRNGLLVPGQESISRSSVCLQLPG